MYHRKADFGSYYSDGDLQFLASIGYKPRELFDFVEDLVDESTPSESSALLIAAVRRDYLMVVQNGKTGSVEITHDDLPTFGDELEGMTYLPRIIVKALDKDRDRRYQRARDMQRDLDTFVGSHGVAIRPLCPGVDVKGDNATVFTEVPAFRHTGLWLQGVGILYR